MFDLFNRLRTPRKRVIAKRQIELLKLLLDVEWMDLGKLIERTTGIYSSLKEPRTAAIRDLNDLIRLGAVKFEKLPENQYQLAVRLEWPTEITETAFFAPDQAVPESKDPLLSSMTV